MVSWSGSLLLGHQASGAEAAGLETSQVIWVLGEELRVLRQPDVLAGMPLLILVVAVVHIAPAVEAAANL